MPFSLVCRLNRRMITFVFAIACLTLLVPPSAQAQRRDQEERRRQVQYDKYDKLQTDFAKSLEEIANFCERIGNQQQAKAIRDLARPAKREGLHTQSLPRQLQPDIATDLPVDERQWRVELRHHQQQHATNLYQLAQRVLEIGDVRFAYDLIYEAIRQNPDCAPAREFLGFERSGTEWVTPFEMRMRRDQMVDTPQFGWLPKDQVARYEAGERYFKGGRGISGRWVSAAQEAELRRDFKNAWVIPSEHYVIKTNHSLERGVELSRQLEDFYQLFFQTFAGFLTTQDQRVALGKGRRRSVSKPFEIHYFREKEDYVTRLRPRVPEIAITTGLYLTDTGIAYFYHQPEMDEDPNGAATRTIFHEATHQLFSETRKSRRKTTMVGEKAHFWIIEGIACYMESFTKENGGYTLGDPEYQRFRAARYRYINDEYYIPLQKLTTMGSQQIQHSPEIRRIYSQASGLAHFFMHYQDGKYRDALIEHLSQLYSRNRKIRESPATLPDLTGIDYSTLDAQYGQFLRQQHEERTVQAEP